MPAKRLATAAQGEVASLVSLRGLVNASAVLPTQSFTRTRTALLRAAGTRIGYQSQVQGPLRLTGSGAPSDISIGDYTLITGFLHIDLGAPVSIGSGVRIGHGVTLLTINHRIGSSWLRAGDSYACPLNIGDGSWIASNVTVLPGVSIGAGAVVAAGAVVSRDVPAHTLVAGVPARVVRELDPTPGFGGKPAA